jgi:hypothetical protein
VKSETIKKRKRLIDATALMANVNKEIARYDDPVKVVSNVLFLIENAPTVDIGKMDGGSSE